jgi:hypothetical protein
MNRDPFQPLSSDFAMSVAAPDTVVRLTGCPNDELLGCDAGVAVTVAVGLVTGARAKSVPANP